MPASAQHGHDVGAGADREARCSAEARGDRVEPGVAVEPLVLERIEDVEAEQPADDGDHEQHDPEPGRRPHREPRPPRRERERDAEPGVRAPGEALGVASSRGGPRARPARGPRARSRAHAAESRKATPDPAASASASPGRTAPGGDVAAARARVLGVDVAVGPAVERHRARARADHAREHRGDAARGVSGHVRVGQREDDRARRERQREDGVGERDERAVGADAGDEIVDGLAYLVDGSTCARRAIQRRGARTLREDERARVVARTLAVDGEEPGPRARARSRPRSSRPSARAPSQVAMRRSSRAGTSGSGRPARAPRRGRRATRWTRASRCRARAQIPAARAASSGGKRVSM